MEIINTRIDARLIHGQVIAYWTSSLKINHIIVIDDDAANNEVTKIALKISCPKNAAFDVLSIKEGCKMIQNDNSNDIVFIVFKTLESYFEAISNGYPHKVATIGNITNNNGVLKLNNSVNFNATEIEVAKELIKQDVKLQLQLVPSDNPFSLNETIKNYRGV